MLETAVLITIVTPSLSDRHFNAISKLVKERCGINLGAGKKQLVKARLAKRLRTLRIEGYDRYIEFVRSDTTGLELVYMLDAISTNLTSFFREADHFDYFANDFLPQLISRATRKVNRLRVWSAGCSSGEEAYSIAITICQNINEMCLWDTKILATDISTRVLSKAAKGLYSADRLKTINPRLKRKYFRSLTQEPDVYKVSPVLRKMVHVARLNLVKPWPMQGPFDAIFCRNVMIYFDKATQGKLIRRYWDMLGSGGVLFVGHSESLAGIDHNFQYIQPTVYQKV